MNTKVEVTAVCQEALRGWNFLGQLGWRLYRLVSSPHPRMPVVFKTGQKCYFDGSHSEYDPCSYLIKFHKLPNTLSYIFLLKLEKSVSFLKPGTQSLLLERRTVNVSRVCMWISESNNDVKHCDNNCCVLWKIPWRQTCTRTIRVYHQSNQFIDTLIQIRSLL